MLEIGAFDAKTHLPQLLDKVMAGEEIIITRRGKPVAQLGPVRKKDPMAAAQAVERMLKRRGRKAPRTGKKLSLRQLAHEGHRY